ncbi:MAG: prepilin-type N-terminal cleavage/methylation domain-containing protein [Gemmataceae bacterium]|nr:prepilin-type N-terminal cleavage/methylation domain-containing protein [Gemmataceae bacterium]
MTTTRRRPGLSLTEVLVALFIMGIGAISILTLFPLGALNMASALKDDRTSQAALQADSLLRSYWASDVVGSPTNPDPFVNAFTDPDASGTADAQAGEPSFPVVLDPMGFVARSGPAQTWVTGLPASLLPRRNLRMVENAGAAKNNLALRTCSLLDGMGFDPARGGDPYNPDSGVVDREYRYNWLWVIQLPRVGDSNTATLTVVVFDKRTHLFVPNLAEAGLTATFTPGQSAVTVPTTQGVILAKGGWVMDGTILPASPGPLTRHAQFYRIVSATDDAAGNTVLELDRPVRRLDGTTGQYTGTLVVLAGVSEVFERPNLTP